MSSSTSSSDEEDIGTKGRKQKRKGNIGFILILRKISTAELL